MTYKKNNDGSFTVFSRSGGLTNWIVNKTMTECNCPKFIYILRRQSYCHHIDEVRQGEQINTSLKIETGLKKFKEEEYITPLTMSNFINEYGLEQMDYLIDNYIIVEASGKLRLL